MTLIAQAMTACILAASPADAAEVQLSGLDCEAARVLIATLRDAQTRLKAGDAMYFELLSGAPASYPTTETSPRQALFDLPLDKTWSIIRVANDNPNWTAYDIDILPEGHRRLMWEVRVLVRSDGDLERVVMEYGPPPPF